MNIIFYILTILPLIAFVVWFFMEFPSHERKKTRTRSKHYKLYDADRIDSLLDGINALRIDGYSIRKAAIKIAPDYEWLAWKMVDRVNKIENIYYYQTKARKNDASAKKNM